MATITGTAGNDSILPTGVSAGVIGGIPSTTNDTVFGSSGNDTIDGEGGVNFLDYSNFTQAISLAYSSYGIGTVIKPTGTDTFTNIDRIWAGSGNDVLGGTAGSQVNNVAIWVRGNAGNDMIDGAGARSFAADYGNSPSAIAVNLGTGIAQDGWGFTDTLVNVRRINLSAFNDVVVGGAFGENFHFSSIGGVHTIDGGGSSDRGNEIRAGVSTSVYIDLGTTAAAGGGFVGTVTKSNGLVDTITRFTRAVGGAGNDTIDGTSGDDALQGEAGNDVLNGRSGYDYVGFIDFPYSGALTQGVIVNLVMGTASDGRGGSDTLIDVEGVFATVFADDLKGRDLGFSTRSLLQGAGGADTLRGAASGFTGADYVNDGAAVIVNLGAGDATDGTGAIDTLIEINAARGSGFNDNITGSAGDDWVNGGNGNDTLVGGSGDDRLLGDNGNDSVNGGAGVDVITGGLGQDTLTGGSGGDRFNFTITATPGEHSSRTTQDLITDFSATEGDYIRLTSTGAAKSDIIYAGQVSGTYASLSVDIVLPAFVQPSGINALNAYTIAHTSLGGWVVVDENSNGIIEAGEFAVRLASAVTIGQVRVNGSSIVTQVGDGTSNTIFITEGVAGGARGLDGDDVIYGGGSFDNMGGGLGNDQFVVRNRDTTLIENAGEGEDTAYVTVDQFTLGANIEIVRMSGTAQRLNGSATGEQLVASSSIASTIFGNGGDDTLWSTGLADTLDGGDGDDIIRGQGGADIMYGGLGNDQFVVFDSGAQIIEYSNGGYDTVYVASSSFMLGTNIEVARLSAAGAVALFGSASSEALVANPGEASVLEGNGGDDTLYGSAFADTLRGGAGDDITRGQGGNDVMAGGAGNDQFVVFTSNSTVVENANEGYDILYFAGSGNFTWVDELEEVRLVDQGAGLVYGGAAAVNKLLVGNNAGLASSIFGGNGSDIIYGTAAADTLAGGAGNDTIYSQGGADRIYTEVLNWGFDLVGGFSTAAGAKLQFAAASGVTSFAQLGINSAGGNTQVSFGSSAILLFGVASLTANDFIFG